jgi:hypothetical protein
VSSMLAGGGLALGAAVALNSSYLMQHRGSAPLATVDGRHPVATLRSLLRAPVWACGAGVGLAGWALHLGAMRLAPLSLVQSFVAGGLALSAPLAALILRRRLTARELQAIGLMVAALLALIAGRAATDAHAAYGSAALAALVGGLSAGAAGLAGLVRGAQRPLALGTAGGLLYAAADLALKAVTGLHGAIAMATSPWLGVALLCTTGAFFAFQRGLQSTRPLAVIALMTGATNVASIAGAFAAFGDSLGRTPLLAAVHALALAGVVAAAWRLAPAEARLAGTADRGRA